MTEVALLALCLLQDPSPERIRALVEQLGADSPTERDQAERILEDAGRSSLPELERAAMSRDSEVALRALRLLRVVPVRVRVTRPVRQAVPGAVGRVLSGYPNEWSTVFCEAAAREDGKPKNPSIRPGDLAPMVDPALRGARSADELRQILALLVAWEMRSAAPEIMAVEGFGPAARAAKVVAVRSLRAREVLGQVQALLDDPDPEVRLQAAGMLVDLEGAKAVGALLRLLNHPDRGVASTAIRALKVIPAGETVQALCEALATAKGGDREELTARLVEICGRESAPLLLDLLKDPQPVVRREAVGGLRNLGEHGAAPSVVALLEDPDAAVRQNALEALAEWRIRSAIPGAIRLLSDLSSSVRGAALDLLGAVGAREAAASVLDLLTDPDDGVRERVSDVLGAMEARSEAPEVLRYLSSDREEVRVQAVVTLGRLRDPGSLVALVERLGGDSWAVRMAAAGALGELGAGGAVGALSRALSDPEPAVALQALLSLEKLHARSEATRIAALLSEPREVLWAEAMRVLGALEAKAEWRAVAGFLNSGDPTLLRRAVVTLEALEARQAAPAIEKLLADPSRPLRIEAAFVLASLGSDKGLDVLLDADLRLIGLNGVRSPEAWRKLRRTLLRESFPNQEETFLGDVIESLSLRVEWDGALREEERREIRAQFFLSPGSCAAWSLEMGIVPEGYGIVLEADRVRIMRADDARRFWKRAFGRATKPGTTVVEE